MSRYRQTMRDVLSEMVEKFSPKEIKMAIGIASDKRYAGGNMTGAVNAIEKIKKGLSKHKQVAAVLKRQNEDIQESGHDDVASAKNQVQIAMSALEKMNAELGKLKDEDALPTWWTNKVAIAVDKLDGMADYLDTQVEETELDEMAYKPGKMKDTRPQERAAKALDKLIQSGGLDKKDFQKVRQLYVQASDAASREKLKKFIYNLDTSPLEAVLDVIGRNDPDTFMKMYPKSKEGEMLSTIAYAHRNVKAEEVELDEGKMKQFHQMMDDGKSAQEIAKALKLDLKTVKELMKEEVELDEAKEVLSRFKDDKLKKSIMNLATQKGLKVKEMGDKLEVSGIARKVMDLTLAVQKHDVKIEQNIMSAYTAAITKGVK